MYRPSPEFQRLTRGSTVSTIADYDGRTASPESTSTSSTRRSTRRRRAAGSNNDLRQASPAHPLYPPSSKRIRSSNQASQEATLSLTATNTQLRASQITNTQDTIRERIEEVDLTEGDEEVLLAKNQEDLLKMQNADHEKPKLADFKCVICLDDPTDLAATPCGHMFCNFCLQGALRAGANQPPNPKSGRCPVCRRRVVIKDVIPLEIKVLQRLKGKGKGRAG